MTQEQNETFPKKWSKPLLKCINVTTYKTEE
jgi:hypothetical protein